MGNTNSGDPIVSLRVPPDLLAWIDEDVAERGKRSRSQWFVDLAQALRDDRIVLRPAESIPRATGLAVTDYRRPAYSKDRQTGRKAKD